MQQWDPEWLQVMATALATVVALTASHYRLRAAMAELMGRVAASGEAAMTAHAALRDQVQAVGGRLAELEQQLVEHGLQLARLQVVLGPEREPGLAVLAERVESLSAEVRRLRDWRHAAMSEAALQMLRGARAES